MPGLGFVGSLSLPYNDEFNDPATLTDPWGENAGDPTTQHLDINSTQPGMLYLQGQLYQVAPATPFTVISKVDYVDWDFSGGDIQVGGIWVVLAQAAPGPYIGFGPDVGVPGFQHYGSSKFDAAGDFDSNPHVVGSMAGHPYDIPHLTKVVVASATSVSASISFDEGETWLTICTGYNPGVTPNYIGLESGGARAGFQWFHVTQP